MVGFNVTQGTEYEFLFIFPSVPNKASLGLLVDCFLLAGPHRAREHRRD